MRPGAPIYLGGVEPVLLEVLPLFLAFFFFFFFLVLVPAEVPASAPALALSLPPVLVPPLLVPVLPGVVPVVPVPDWAKAPAEASATLARTARPLFHMLM
jgi:hypothetical protein